jgi:Uma2 family endonuclease
MTTQTQLMTAEDLLRLPHGGQLHELIEGVLTTMAPPGGDHGLIAAEFSGELRAFVRANNLGRVFIETGFIIRRNPDTVRLPDVAFVSRERMAAIGRVTGFMEGAPDLAVEIISPSDLYNEVADKVAEWLAAGTRMVLVIDPRQRTVTVRRPPTDVTILTENDEIDGADVVPGWRLPVPIVFE